MFCTVQDCAQWTRNMFSRKSTTGSPIYYVFRALYHRKPINKNVRIQISVYLLWLAPYMVEIVQNSQCIHGYSIVPFPLTYLLWYHLVPPVSDRRSKYLSLSWVMGGAPISPTLNSDHPLWITVIMSCGPIRLQIMWWHHSINQSVTS